MFNNLNRKNLIQGWFLVVCVAAALIVVLRGSPSLTGTVEMLALTLIPPAIVLMLWPGIEPPTASEVIHGVDRR